MRRTEEQEAQAYLQPDRRVEVEVSGPNDAEKLPLTPLSRYSTKVKTLEDPRQISDATVVRFT